MRRRRLGDKLIDRVISAAAVSLVPMRLCRSLSERAEVSYLLYSALLGTRYVSRSRESRGYKGV